MSFSTITTLAIIGTGAYMLYQCCPTMNPHPANHQSIVTITPTGPAMVISSPVGPAPEPATQNSMRATETITMSPITGEFIHPSYTNGITLPHTNPYSYKPHRNNYSWP